MLNCRELIWGQAGDKRVTSVLAYSHLDQAQTLRARARVQASEASICCYETRQKGCRSPGPPTASLLPIVAQRKFGVSV
jgi:hypothetical protein